MQGGRGAAGPEPVPVLEVGGTHVTAALARWRGERAEVVVRERVPLDSDGPRDQVLGALVAAGCRLGAPVGAAWGVAIPGPFDYEAGVGVFDGVGKFESLRGVDVGAELGALLRPRPRRVRFVNDADAFGIGEAVGGAARGFARSVCLTIGTGVGSAFVADGLAVHDGPSVPPGGHAYRIVWDGRPLEERVSRRALCRRFREAGGDPLDVHQIAGLARSGVASATRVFDEVFEELGRAIGPWVRAFGAGAVVVGGSIARSWTLVGPPLRRGLTHAGAGDVALLEARDPEGSPLVGAAAVACR